jgi:hypothetical protein
VGVSRLRLIMKSAGGSDFHVVRGFTSAAKADFFLSFTGGLKASSTP